MVRDRIRLGAGTLRARLTIWYMLLLALTLLLFSGYLYFQVQRTLLAQVDSSLQVAASQALANIENENGSPAFQDTEHSQVVVRRLIQAGFAVRLIALDGTVRDGFGDHLALPMWVPQMPGYANLAGEGDPWRVYSQLIETPDGRIEGWLQAAQSLQPIYETLENLRTQLILGLPLVLLLAGWGGLFLADRALRPIDGITRTARAISGSDLSRRIGHQGPPDEVGRLATTFDRMLDRLQDAFERERRFTADASHELRTPLAALKGRIGVTLSRPRSRADYEHTLRDLEHEVDRLIRLSTDLLFLSRLDQGRHAWRPESLELSHLLSAIVEQVQPMAQASALTLTADIPEGLSVQGSPDNLIRLLLNLLDNAVRYTPSGGQISLRAEDDGTQVRVSVTDTGPGISPEHLPHLFERFYRAQADRSREVGGAGLGLAIAYEIARWHGGDLEVESEPGQGTTFTLHLPVQPPNQPSSSSR
jgi:heavy metal sensor kinase